MRNPARYWRITSDRPHRFGAHPPVFILGEDELYPIAINRAVGTKPIIYMGKKSPRKLRTTPVGIRR
jgi:hypothetical protein